LVSIQNDIRTCIRHEKISDSLPYSNLPLLLEGLP
jgi:hypothetical protein